MELSVREVASLLGKSQRAIRAQLVRGDLRGKKRNGQWRVERRHLPLTEAQRSALQQKAEAVRQAVDEVLPSRMAWRHGQRTRSIADLDAFRCGAELLIEIRAAEVDDLPSSERERAARLLESALLQLAEAVQHFEPALKLAALNRARAGLARATALLLLRSGMPPREPLLVWISALESEILPAVAGLARWVEKLRGRRP